MFSLQTIFGQGNQFYTLLEEAAVAAHDSTKALHEMLKDSQPAAAAGRVQAGPPARARGLRQDQPGAGRTASSPRSSARTSRRCGSALYKIPKQVEKFADRYSLALQHLDGIDFAPRAAMLEQASGVVVQMVHQLRGMKLEPMKELNDKLRAIENEADRLMLELYRDIYSGRLDNLQMFLLKEFFEILEKAIDRCREAGVVAYQIVLKNS